ncbi:MAG: ATP-dependent RecD-like DNA helicase [Oscillospiraceae bacterium]|nr:ATP-dependent RecD-like DNA helicase [Oscillospiraceae bacterium]
MEEERENTLRGTVENVLYKNEANGYAVVDLDVNGEMVTVTGSLFGVCEGEELTVWGAFSNHPTYGVQFCASACERVLPSSATAILRYLSGGAIAGVGPVFARRIVEAFAENSLEVISKTPEKLCAVKGISPKKAKAIAEEFKKIFGVRETLAALAALGIDTDCALRLYRAWGESSPEMVRSNPYILCGEPAALEFSFADALAAQMGIEGEHTDRLRACLVYTLRRNLENGHCCLPAETLKDRVAAFLSVSRDSVEIELYNSIDRGFLAIAVIDGAEMIFLPPFLRAERLIAERLLLLNSLSFRESADADSQIDEFEKYNDISYDPLQRRAIAQALTGGAVVITGGPGTGKTTALKAIIELCERSGEEVALCAPTGRAAKRLSELTGREARTIHRLLEVRRGEGDKLVFAHDENDPLKFDAVIIDEMSMVDARLFESLLRGLRSQCRLIMVGDFNQLPSVGAGNILRDIIDSGVVETLEFRTIFRQAAESLIVLNAHRVVAGEPPDTRTRESDFFMLEKSPQGAVKTICDLVARRLPKSYGLDAMSDIQVLTPSRQGLLGVANLGGALREALNPRAENKAEIKVMGHLFREGDKIMQSRNNYDIQWTRDGGESGLGAFNGDLGIIESIDRRAGTISCLFDDRRLTYTAETAVQLEPAYAITVHKSQGSEFPAVVLALGDFSPKLSYRNLLYTALTRARRLLVIVGEEERLFAMTANARKTLRYTGLKAFLRGEA